MIWCQNYDKIRETNKPSIERWTILFNVVMNVEKPSSLLNKVHRNSARKMTRTVQLQAWRVHTLQLMLKSGCW